MCLCSYLFDKGKDSVVLYVAHDNRAKYVYQRVGFANETVPGVEPWLEVGFDQRCVTLGHW